MMYNHHTTEQVVTWIECVGVSLSSNTEPAAKSCHSGQNIGFHCLTLRETMRSFELNRLHPEELDDNPDDSSMKGKVQN